VNKRPGSLKGSANSGESETSRSRVHRHEGNEMAAQDNEKSDGPDSTEESGEF